MSQVCTLPQLSENDFEQKFSERHLVHKVISKWATERPDRLAIISADTGQGTTWAELEAATLGVAAHLLELGYKKGDCLVTALPLTTEHIILEYACFRIGVIFAPLDLRLSAPEMIRSIRQVQPKGFAFPGVTPLGDFREVGRAIGRECPFVEHKIQFSPREETIAEATAAADLFARASELRTGSEERVSCEQSENDAALIIFTTGSTGSPKPALLSHRNITCQNMCISQAFFGGDSGMKTLVNLPPSHVGCQTELLMGTLFGGGTAVILASFDPVRSLKAIQEYKIEIVGQIPAMFEFEWRVKTYEEFDLSSLKLVAYGGQQVSEAFVAKMSTMSPWVATGLGLTEAAGFCTYESQPRETARQCAVSLGSDMPVYPVSIRREMRGDGFAGDELPAGETGHICFRGPQTFLGYLNDPASTANTISKDGFLYTGDLGYKDANGLHLSGRAKWVIKPAGYQVFPVDVEAHICALADKVASCAVAGVDHAVLSEAIVAFVEKKHGAELSVPMLEKHARSLASYMRPRHYVLLESGGMPLNRAAKADYVRLAEMAKTEVGILRAKGKWDRA
ncbi:MAG: class I adenylate-forming enzyme family protein [Candidatus Sulfotelmatobacter sp.]|jgi:acyl-CoA synthetase (AMP-forming)/AMP-acid ligase II